MSDYGGGDWTGVERGHGSLRGPVVGLGETKTATEPMGFELKGGEGRGQGIFLKAEMGNGGRAASPDGRRKMGLPCGREDRR